MSCSLSDRTGNCSHPFVWLWEHSWCTVPDRIELWPPVHINRVRSRLQSRNYSKTRPSCARRWYQCFFFLVSCPYSNKRGSAPFNFGKTFSLMKIQVSMILTISLAINTYSLPPFYEYHFSLSFFLCTIGLVIKMARSKPETVKTSWTLLKFSLNTSNVFDGKEHIQSICKYQWGRFQKGLGSDDSLNISDLIRGFRVLDGAKKGN